MCKYVNNCDNKFLKDELFFIFELIKHWDIHETYNMLSKWMKFNWQNLFKSSLSLIKSFLTKSTLTLHSCNDYHKLSSSVQFFSYLLQI